MTAFNKKNLDIIKNAVIYTGATISPNNITKSKEKPERVLIDGGRTNHAYHYLRQAEFVISQMYKELENNKT